MTAEPWPEVVCAYRETRTDGTHECIGYPQHDTAHVLRLLVRRPAEEESA